MEKIEDSIVNYIISYHSKLMTNDERENFIFLSEYYKKSYSLENEPDCGWIEGMKITKVKFVQKKRDTLIKLVSLYRDKAENIDELINIGFEDYRKKIAERILNEHANEIKLNICPKCNKIARTPYARQCRYCGYNWRKK
jgi:hypothetical protein